MKELSFFIVNKKLFYLTEAPLLNAGFLEKL